MKILVLGARGMLGSAVYDECQSRELSVARSDADILDARQLRDVRSAIRPTVVINCAGVIPEKSDSVERMLSVNGRGPHIIADVFAGAHIVQVSTDCVFSGRQKHGYFVTDVPDPVDEYGRSKYSGELTEPNTTTVRTSFVGWNHGLMAWLLRHRDSEVQGYACTLWSGSTVITVARYMVDIACGNPRGLMHLAAPCISKYEVLRALRDALNLTNLIITPVQEPKIYRNLAPTIQMPPFTECVQELVRC